MNTPRRGPGPDAGVRRERAARIQLPLLDRLMNPDTAEQPPASPAEALAALRAAVLRDLEALLNARRRRVPLPAGLAELESSLVAYGIPDPASGAYLVPENRTRLAAEIEATIRRFEPRLEQVSVSLVGGDDALSATLKLKVEAVLRSELDSEAVSFETLLEPVSRDVTVRDS